MKSSKKKSKHPSLDIVGTLGTELSGKRIVLCVAGSVAVYKAIELARLLMRYGGNVVCVASSAATKLVRPDYFKWATGNPVITKLTGDLEHIEVADYKRSDLIIVYPGTANTLGKLANGIGFLWRKVNMKSSKKKSKHPSLDIVGTLGTELSGKRNLKNQLEKR